MQNLAELLDEALLEDCTVLFKRGFSNQIEIQVSKYLSRGRVTQIKQSVPNDHHIDLDRVKKLISYCINELKTRV